MAIVSRFQVMAMLQAARARALGMRMDEAKSFGLNRAIFYAAAKRGWSNARAMGIGRPVIGEFERSRQVHDRSMRVGDEKVFLGSPRGARLRFKFGDELQTPQEFDRQVRDRIPDWEAAWAEANRIVKNADRSDLFSQSRFYRNVYEPRRDRLAEFWSVPRADRAA